MQDQANCFIKKKLWVEVLFTPCAESLAKGRHNENVMVHVRAVRETYFVLNKLLLSLLLIKVQILYQSIYFDFTLKESSKIAGK